MLTQEVASTIRLATSDVVLQNQTQTKHTIYSPTEVLFSQKKTVKSIVDCTDCGHTRLAFQIWQQQGYLTFSWASHILSKL